MSSLSSPSHADRAARLLSLGRHVRSRLQEQQDERGSRAFIRRDGRKILYVPGGQITPEAGPAPSAKIFRLTCRPNQSHNSARLTADEGRWPSSRTRGEMRWTQTAR